MNTREQEVRMNFCTNDHKVLHFQHCAEFVTSWVLIHIIRLNIMLSIIKIFTTCRNVLVFSHQISWYGRVTHTLFTPPTRTRQDCLVLSYPCQRCEQGITGGVKYRLLIGAYRTWKNSRLWANIRLYLGNNTK